VLETNQYTDYDLNAVRYTVRMADYKGSYQGAKEIFHKHPAEAGERRPRSLNKEGVLVDANNKTVRSAH